VDGKCGDGPAAGAGGASPAAGTGGVRGADAVSGNGAGPPAGGAGGTGTSAAQLAWSSRATNAAPWSTMPASTYSLCAEKLDPCESHTRSLSTHRSMVLGRYWGPMATGGSLIACMNRTDGFPNSATAATLLATSGGKGAGTSEGETPSGTALAVTKPITAAPWENPPSTILVWGQFAAVVRTCVRASVIPSTAVGKSVVAG
jgi:hypothetical protein